ncbi:DegT/DnrJ/EryC1/StrS family aminotransferase [Bacillus subtilis]
MLITNNQEIYEKAVLLGHFNMRAIRTVHLKHLKKFAETGYGLNYRMHPLGGAMALVQFSKLDERIQLRNDKLNYLSKQLSGLPGIRTPITRTHVTRGAFYGYKIRYISSELNNLEIELFVKAMQAEGVLIKGTGYKPLHLTALFSGTPDGLDNFSYSLPYTRKAYNEGDLPISEKIYSVSLSLPTFTYEPYSIIDEYVSAFEKVINNVEKLV